MDKLIFLLSEGLKNLWRHKLTAFSAIFSMFLTLFVLGSLIIATENTNKVIEYLRDKYKIEVFFKDEITTVRANELVEDFKKIRGIRSTTIISKADAESIFKSQFGENILDLVGYNPLPVSCVLNVVKNRTDAVNIQPIINQLRSYPEVDEVNYQGRLIARIESFYQKFVRLMTGILILIMFISVLIISNTVRLTIYAKKELIEALQLIGASRSFVKTPFLIEGVFHGLFGAMLASSFLIGGLYLGESVIQSLLGLDINYDIFFLISMLFGIGILISILGSSRAISRFLK